LGIKIVLNTEVTPELIAEIKPDVVILATGGIPRMPRIPGINKDLVCNVLDVLSGKVKVGQKIVVVGSGGFETAAFLAEQKKDVTAITSRSSDDMLKYMGFYPKAFLLRRLHVLGVRILNNVRVQKITDEGVVVRDKASGETKFIAADNVVIGLGLEADKNLEKKLASEIKFFTKVLSGWRAEIYTIGDCVKPRALLHAIHEGAHIARLI
ncbi:MAG: FAD-dependent oxidoreductase, partial [Candidatus Baldrarchaeia archaeon]